MNKTIISTSAAPAAIGPYSQGVRVGDLFFFSGMIPIDPATGALVGEDAPAQAEQVCRNIRALLAAASLTPAHIVKTTVFLTDLSAFAAVNEVYARLFESEPPARSCVEVAALPKGRWWRSSASPRCDGRLRGPGPAGRAALWRPHTKMSRKRRTAVMPV